MNIIKVGVAVSPTDSTLCSLSPTMYGEEGGPQGRASRSNRLVSKHVLVSQRSCFPGGLHLIIGLHLVPALEPGHLGLGVSAHGAR